MGLAVIGFALLFFLMPVWACGCKVAGPATACMSNLKQQSIGLLQYAEDHDGRLTDRDFWVDQIRPYVKDKKVFGDPAVKGGYGQAFNGSLSRAELPPKHPEKVPMVYDSSNPIRNASDLVTSLPVPGRHNGGNNVAYADSHARRIHSPKP